MFTHLLAASLVVLQSLPVTLALRQPIAKVQNGTYSGVYLPQYEQNVFLGIPYAQDTGGKNRFRVPQTLSESWDDVRSATEYGNACPDFSAGDQIYGMSENCLNINIVVPSNISNCTKLPIMFWIHGGSWQEGTTGLSYYNLTWLVQRSVEIGKPVIGVSINYRVGVWGNIFSQEILGSGNANLGLRDIYKSLEWVKENIAAFGGNPDSVTLWGESSGAFAVGQMMIAYGGRPDGLFHRTIQESGSATTAWYNGTDWYQPKYDNIVNQVGCNTTADTLECLRTVSYESLYPYTYYYAPDGPLFYPTVDGDIIPLFPTELMAQGRFAQVPHILGCNSDEGAGQYPYNVTSDEDLFNVIDRQGWRYPEEVRLDIMRLYPDDPTQGVPIDTGTERFEEHGAQFKRAAAIFGDVYYHGPRLDDARVFSKYNLNNTFVFRFNTRAFVNGTYVDPTTNATIVDYEGHLAAAYLGVQHAAELSFVFQNLAGVGPWPEYRKLSKEMSAAWILFAHTGNPNPVQASLGTGQGLTNVTWPTYGSTGSDKLGKLLVLQTDSQGGIHVEEDSYRLAGRELLQKWAKRRRV